MNGEPAQFTLPFTHYSALGYDPIPIIPHDHPVTRTVISPGKQPAGGKGWYEREYSAAEFAALDKTDHNVGLRCSNVIGIDIDVSDARVAALVEKLCRKMLKLPKGTPTRIGNAPKALLVARVNAPLKGFDIREHYVNEKGKAAQRVVFQILGHGKQFVIHGTHPTTKRPYRLSGPLPRIAELALVSSAQLTALKAALLAMFTAEGFSVAPTGEGKGKVTGSWSDPAPWTETGMKQAWAALDALSPDMARDDWRAIGIALHDGTHGSEEGFAMWDAWSSQSDKYKDGECAYQWEHFKAGAGFTRATLFKNPYQKADAKPVEAVRVNDAPHSRFFSTAREVLQQRLPDRRQFVADTIQIGCTLLHGPGKKGKSWWLLDMADHIAHGKPTFLNRAVTQANVLLIGAEDMAHRFEDRLSLMQIAPSDALITMHREQLKEWGEEFQPMQGDEQVDWTPKLLIETLHKQTGADVIILDTQEVVELTLKIEHGDRSTSLTRQHYMSTSSYDEIAQHLGISIILVAHWGAIKSLPMAVTNPHEMINTTKTKIAGALTSITLGPMANQELDDDSGQVQLSVMGKDITTGNRYEAIERHKVTQRHTYLGTSREVILRDSLQQLMVALETLLKEKGPNAKVTSAELAERLGIGRSDTVRKKMVAIERNAQVQAQRQGKSDARVYWRGQRLMSSHAGYWLEA